MGLPHPDRGPWTEEELLECFRRSRMAAATTVALERLQAKQGGAAPGLATAAGPGKLRGMVQTRPMTTTTTAPRRRESRRLGPRLAVRLTQAELDIVNATARAQATTTADLVRQGLILMGTPIDR